MKHPATQKKITQNQAKKCQIHTKKHRNTITNTPHKKISKKSPTKKNTKPAKTTKTQENPHHNKKTSAAKPTPERKLGGLYAQRVIYALNH